MVCRPIAEVNGFGSACIHLLHQIAVDFLCDEGCEGCCQFYHGFQNGIQCHISIDFILFHAFCPETLTASSYIPVGQVIQEINHCTGRLCQLVALQRFIHEFIQCLQLGENPFIHGSQLFVIQCVLCRIELIDFCVQDVESVCVPQRTHEFSLHFGYSLIIIARGQPRRGVCVEVPTNRICTLLIQCIPRVNNVAFMLGHLLTVLILHMSQNDAVLIGSLIEQQCADSQ